jgi:hypothetical protein
MPFIPRAGVKVLQIGFRALPYFHAPPSQAIMRKVERLRQRDCIAESCRNRFRMIERKASCVIEAS